MRRGLAFIGMLASGCALMACDALFGIQTFADPSPDEAGADATTEVGDSSQGSDAPVESGPSSDGDAAAPHDGDAVAPRDATLDGTAQDAAADAPEEVIPHCTPQCDMGSTQCVGSQLQTCVLVQGCPRWDTPVACGGGGTCWGTAFTAYCCAGGSSVCAPSCHVPTAGDPDAGNGQGNCGRMGNESCCTTLDVTGGTFKRSYDGVTATDATSPATISSFGLDKYEVTVGRFRQFVNVFTAGLGWLPSDGDGVHVHLNGGNGLVDSSGDGGTFEHGWYSGFDSNIPTAASLSQYLEEDPAHSTWTTSPGPHEAFAINSVNWYLAYAFCIWDGGFLPSEAEWNYAASGGSDQRVYAWSTPPTSMTIGSSYADYQGGDDTPALVGIFTSGYGKYGHADLTGGEFEWTLDYGAPYVTPCYDCAYMSDPGTNLRTLRGASWNYPANALYVATRVSDDPTIHYSNDGFRCARPP